MRVSDPLGERILAKDYLRMCPRFERMHHLGGSAHFDRDDYEISTFPILYSLRDLPTAKLSLTLNRLLATIESDFYKASEMLLESHRQRGFCRSQQHPHQQKQR